MRNEGVVPLHQPPTPRRPLIRRNDAIQEEVKTAPPLTSWRVEANAPAIQHVYARTKEEAIAKACAKRDDWDVDLNAEIDTDHVTDAENNPEDVSDDE